MEYIMYLELPILLGTFREIMGLNIFILLYTLVTIDFITGTFKAIYLKEMDSEVGSKGLMKHITIITLTILMLMVGELGNIRIVGYVFTSFYIFEYAVSIMENTHKLGVPYPKFIKDRIIQMHDKFNNWGEYDE